MSYYLSKRQDQRRHHLFRSKKCYKKYSKPDRAQSGVNKIKNIRNNAIVIECKTKDEHQIFKNQINSKINEFEAKIPLKKKPKIIIYNIPKSVDTQNIIENIVTQNQFFNISTNEKNYEQKINYKLSLKSRNKNVRHLVFEIDPEIRKLIMNQKYLNIEWNRCECADFISITRCTSCLAFGHFKNACKAEVRRSHCSSAQHS